MAPPSTMIPSGAGASAGGGGKTILERGEQEGGKVHPAIATSASEAPDRERPAEPRWRPWR